MAARGIRTRDDDRRRRARRVENPAGRGDARSRRNASRARRERRHGKAGARRSRRWRGTARRRSAANGSAATTEGGSSMQTVRTRWWMLACMAPGLTGCAGAPPIVNASAADCAGLVPADWREGVAGAELPDEATAGAWIAFADAQTGRLDQANARTPRRAGDHRGLRSARTRRDRTSPPGRTAPAPRPMNDCSHP